MQPAIRAGGALLPLQKLLADNGERDVTAMRGSAVLEQKNRKIPCQVPSCMLPSTIGTLSLLRVRTIRMCILILQNPLLGRAISIKNIVQHRVCACSIPS